ncbi:kinesin-like protein KIN-12B [Nicotiana tabacum]|uniref:Kinesin-like protein KIN-12B n=2 Tax=Nicotiana TaxID=4085 RepID=A0A1S4C928_TOBAC|nr:PREDICTED: kinesin-like protein KIN12B [Nicotiana sylvestris]XP_016497638.1 PREDICTED: kinesin-like protein KIN12B [Nicotiana tabacum]
MKHNVQQPRSTILRENHEAMPPASPNPSSTTKQQQKWLTPPPYRKNKSSSKENANPNSDLNSSPAVTGVLKMKSPLPPRHPNSNPLKRKLSVESENGATVAAGSSDSGVKVIVRMRPPIKDEEEGETVLQKVSNDSLSISGHTFTFDSIADTQSTQLDIFQLVGAPLVENCLAGFNSSVFAYGQTGSGKTYTIWGPANALLEENLASDQQGLTPRVFQRLFERIEEEQIKHSDKQLVYQCRCSFLEIYNEQITDLLDPSQRNLQIREDVRTGVYVENLTEECVSTMKDVTKLLMKGLSNRRTGATSINAESSRSHSVFTCVVESRCKRMADGLSCLKSSRINLVDLAGSERQKLTGAAGERLKEAGNINRSLSQLGNLINILAEVSQTGKHRHIPYRDSKLTFLLQESLGGNAKLAMICAISPAPSCKSETFSTLRFAQRAKAIKNKAVVNEEMQDDVNVLREVIRQLKDELIRVKANGSQADQNGNYSSGWNARRSLNLLKFSLKRPIDDDGDTEMEIVEEAELLGLLPEGSKEIGILRKTLSRSSLVVAPEGHDEEKENTAKREEGSEDTDVTMEEEVSEHVQPENKVIDCAGVRTLDNCSMAGESIHQSCEEENVEAALKKSMSKRLDSDLSREPIEVECLPSLAINLHQGVKRELVEETASEQCEDYNERTTENSSKCLDGDAAFTDLSIVTNDKSPILKSPTPSVSPRVNSSRKSLRTSSMLSASQKDLRESKLDAPHLSFAKPSNSICLNSQPNQRSKSCFTSTEHLAASLHRGLEIISNHQSTSLRRSSFRFSCKPADIRAIIPVAKADVGVQTSIRDSIFLCGKCKARNSKEETKDAKNDSNMQLVPVDGSQLVPADGSQSCGKFKIQVPKAVEKVLAGAIRREMALEEICAKQTSEIMQLNRLIQQYKLERECNAIIGQTREDKIVRLESLMDGILPTDEFMEDELLSLTHEHKLLKEKYENHPEISSAKIELRRVQDELERYRNFFDLGEREVLLEEIQDLRSQLQFYVDFSPKSSKKGNSPLQLTYPSESSEPSPLSTIPESTEASAEQRLERERIQWAETESKWISLVEELRLDLDASRSMAEKHKQELDLEKKCSEELKEAMQMAMQGHARMLEQYAELEEKHMQLLIRHRKIQDGVEDVKKAAAKAGVRGAESKFINALAAEISALKVEREKERRIFREENKGLQAQLRDTAEAVQAAGELLVRLKEAEEAIAAAEKRAIEAEQEANAAYKQIDKLKKKHEREINNLNQLLEVSSQPKERSEAIYDNSVTATYEVGEVNNNGDKQWTEEFKSIYNREEDLTNLGEPSSWFSGYDRCNI